MDRPAPPASCTGYAPAPRRWSVSPASPVVQLRPASPEWLSLGQSLSALPVLRPLPLLDGVDLLLELVGPVAQRHLPVPVGVLRCRDGLVQVLEVLRYRLVAAVLLGVDEHLPLAAGALQVLGGGEVARLGLGLAVG